MNYNRINNITGWIVCIIACAVYLMTMEATGSLWDCGEFASSAYKLQIPHPPGAPMFTLIGRLFMAPFDPQHAATGINTMSALASGFTILFLFWTITHFARKLTEKNGGELNNQNIFIIMAAGVVGGLAYTFSDSFWYSAVEGEVYSLSSFFTAVVFWAMCKWDQAVDDERKEGVTGEYTRADRWIVLIFYLMGLSIGVHLLNLLTIPAIVMVYYFKKYKATNWGTVIAFVIGCVITGLIQKAVIQWTIQLAGKTDVLFVNSFGLPFFTGFGFFFLLIGGLIYLGIRMAKQNGWHLARLGLWCTAFILLGYSTYITPLIRSSANPSMDMYNVDNPVSLAGYLSREQYGDWPILYGHDFNTAYSDVINKETYVKGEKEYELKGRKQVLEYDAADKSFFPRMWDASNDQGHADYYASFMGLPIDPKNGNFVKDQNGRYLNEDGEVAKPTLGQKINFFFSYQVNTMYWRYFMWNFAGKQNDIQGISGGNVRDGNWKSGIGFIDAMRLGDQSKLPDSIKNNKANNSLYFLPFILGIIGCIYHYKRDWKNALINTLLWFFTGLAIVIYLNMAGPQPRERDYAFVGSGYAFCAFIGLGVMQIKEWFLKFIKNGNLAGYAAAGLCLIAVPVLMASVEWDDHDRSEKLLARDLAKNYLNSCDSNAIVFSYGDNDTYPLWYAQEVEGIRKDIRVINFSLLGTDWYINQLRYKVNNSPGMDPIWTKDQVMGANRDIIVYRPMPGMDQTQPMDLYTAMKDWAGSDDPKKMFTPQGSEESYNTYPSKNFKIPVDVNAVRSNGTVNASDTIPAEIQISVSKNTLYKNESAVLNIIAANKWQRPIYFTSPSAGGGLGLDSYLRQDGLTYRFVPIRNPNPRGLPQTNLEDVKTKMAAFSFGNANKKGVYFDEENRRHLLSNRRAFVYAAYNFANAGKKEEGKNLLNMVDAGMLESNMPYGMVSRNQEHNQVSLQMMDAAYRCDNAVLAEKIGKSLKKDLEQQMRYYESLSDNRKSYLEQEINFGGQMLESIKQIEAEYKKPEKPAEPASIEKGTTPVNPADTQKKIR